jgi:hypothetical protein
MSVILEFIEIERRPDCIVSENKTCGIFEVTNDQVKKLDSFLTKNTELFHKLLKDPHSIWQGEVYNIPWMNHYAFFILAVDFEMNVGYRNADGALITLAFEPKSIDFVVTSAIKNIKSAADSLSKLKALLEKAIARNSLIVVSWG